MAKEQMLVALEEYLKSGIHIGTKYRTKDMSPFIYKIRNDGLSVFNVQEIDKRLKIASNFISQYPPEEIIIVCRRENGWDSVQLFSKLTNIKSFAKRYLPGILTNVQLENFTEAKLLIAVDPWPDKNAINDAIKAGMTIVALCDTNNDAKNVDLIMPCNNKGRKSLALIFYILTREYLKNRKLIKKDSDFKYKIEDFEGQE
jgi:small subunit ribosomal protein S2